MSLRPEIKHEEENFDGYHIEITDEPIPSQRQDAIRRLGRIVLRVPTSRAISIYETWQEYEKEQNRSLLGAFARIYIDHGTEIGVLADVSELAARDIKDPGTREEAELTAYRIMQTTAEGKPDAEYVRAEGISSSIKSISITPTSLDIEARKEARMLTEGDLESFRDNYEEELAAYVRTMPSEERELFEPSDQHLPQEYEEMFFREEFDRAASNPDNFQTTVFSVADQLAREAAGTGISVIVNAPKL